MRSLQTLKMKEFTDPYNENVQVGPVAFQGIPSLQILDLSNNRLERVILYEILRIYCNNILF